MSDIRFRLISNKIDDLYEMAYSRQKILHDLENSVDYIVEHLIQLFLFRDPECRNHWISEVYRGCNKMPKWLGSKKYLPIKDVQQRLWYGWSDSYDDYIEAYLDNVSIKEQRDIPEFTDDNLYSFIADYFEWLSISLSAKGIITLYECSNKINSLLSKYPVKE